jgi:hypothetical protein
MLRDYSIGKMLLNYDSTVVVSEGMMTKPHFPKQVSHEALSFPITNHLLVRYPPGVDELAGCKILEFFGS